MKKLFFVLIAATLTVIVATAAFAVVAGKRIEFDGKGAGKVIFDGKTHAAKGLHCEDCHASGIFKQKKGADVFTMKDINDGKYCGACHNGTKAFDARVAANCVKCHIK